MAEKPNQTLPVGVRHRLTTEKAAGQAAAPRPVHTFAVEPSVNKTALARAIKVRYGVVPLKINMIRVKPRRVSVRGRPGVKPGGKKALVYLRAGDKLE